MISSAASSARGRGTGGSGDGVSAQHADPVLERKAWKNADVGPPVSLRGGDLRCELKGDRVLIGGQATLYMKGKIFLRLRDYGHH